MDVAKIMQMYLKKEYTATTAIFQRRLSTNSTPVISAPKAIAAVLDLTNRNCREPSAVYSGVPMSSFGHTGFTGTIAWADPKTN
jgi:CubicO group peptidase (beta-lactamase class C family)